MTPSQTSAINLIKRHVADLDHWNIIEINEEYGNVYFQISSEKWHQDSVMGNIGKRGAFTRWGLDKNNKFLQDRNDLKIILEVYVR